MNHVILVGRLTDSLEAKNENGQTRMVMVLAVPRTFRNSSGIYETDFIRCILWNGIAERTREYCKKGDMICVRGRLQVHPYETKENEKKYLTEVIVESVAFVSSVGKSQAKEQNEQHQEKNKK